MGERVLRRREGYEKVNSMSGYGHLFPHRSGEEAWSVKGHKNRGRLRKSHSGRSSKSACEEVRMKDNSASSPSAALGQHEYGVSIMQSLILCE